MDRLTLRELALKHGTDKAGGRDDNNRHEYCEAYEFFLKDWRDDEFSMLELGFGGYEFPDRGGQSMNMWAEYFSKAQIFILDLYVKTIPIPRFDVRIYKGHQTDDGIANYMYQEMKYHPRLIIDDASHVNPLTIKSFELYWKFLAPGGIYVVEDVHSSYWITDGFEGGDHPYTVMEYFKRQADFLNEYHWAGRKLEYEKPYVIPTGEGTIEYEKPKMVDYIESIHFFKEIIFIRKKM